MSRRRLAFTLVVLGASLLVSGCNRYTVYFRYPEERANFFNERPQTSIYVAEPADLRPSNEREGRGVIGTLRFPADDSLDLPASSILRRALMQDLLTTRVARLVQNPDNADFVLSTQVLSMTTVVKRKPTQFMVPLFAGAAIGALSAVGTDASHGIKLGLVGVVLGTFIPLPTHTEGNVEVRLELKDRDTNEVVWSTNCNGNESAKVFMSVSARDDKKLAERFLPRALKRANACAVGQLYQYLQENEVRTAAAR